MLVFEREIMELSHRDLYFVEVPDCADGGSMPDAGLKTGTLPVDSIAAIVSASLPDDVKVTGVNVFSDPERAWQVSLSKPGRTSVYVDQYTGEIKGQYERAPFFTFMFRMHRWLLDSMKPGETVFWGKVIVGTSTLMFVLVLVSGIMIWWPRTSRVLKNRLKITVSKGWRRFWYDLHVAGGIYACVFLLAMALTGLTWSFQWYRTGFYKVFGVETSAGGHGRAGAGNQAALSGRSGEQTRQHGSSDKTGRNDNSGQGRKNISESMTAAAVTAGVWQTVYERLAADNPGYSRISLMDGAATVSFDRPGNRRAADRYRFDKADGTITEAVMYKDSDRASKIRGWIYSVHVGSWGGIVTRILAFIAAIVGASLPLTGYWMWLRRLYGRKKASGKG